MKASGKRGVIARAVWLTLAGIALAVTLAGCGRSNQTVTGSELTAGQRNAAQAALNALQHSSIPQTLLTVTYAARLAPATCRVHLESGSSRMFDVYVFWIPYIGPSSYTWLNMRISEDSSRDAFHLGTAISALPGGKLAPNGRTIIPRSVDFDAPLALYGPQQAKRTKQVLAAHAGDVFSNPGAKCEVLTNGYLRLIPHA